MIVSDFAAKSSNILVLLFATFGCIVARNNVAFRDQRSHHTPRRLDSDQMSRLVELTDTGHMEEILDNICVKRVVGTEGHRKVKTYIKQSMKNLGWDVESDLFEDKTPNFGKLEFENIIARLNPSADRYLVLACHFDSKYTREGDFVGATDSAVPCAQMINLAKVMKRELDSHKNQNVSLMLIFFDGEEAFESWGPKDSIYGARHLARKWHSAPYPPGNTAGTTELDRIDVLVLLDLLGGPDPTIYNYFKSTEKWYGMLVEAESKLASMKKLNGYSYGQPKQKYFQPYSFRANIEDDHIPFLIKDVPILHLIPSPFPWFWHQSSDNRNNIDMNTTENLNKILRVFVASYLKLNV